PRFIGAAPGRRAHKEAKGPPLAAPVAATPLMVGREGELAQLREWFASVRQRERRVVVIAGGAGIRKSTFLRRLLRSAEKANWRSCASGSRACANASGGWCSSRARRASARAPSCEPSSIRRRRTEQ